MVPIINIKSSEYEFASLEKQNVLREAIRNWLSYNVPIAVKDSNLSLHDNCLSIAERVWAHCHTCSVLGNHLAVAFVKSEPETNGKRQIIVLEF